MNISMLKDFKEMPDFYKIKISYVTSKKEEIDSVSHKIINEGSYLEILTKEDLWMLIPLNNIECIEFSKEFSKIIELKNKDKGNAL